MINNSVAPAMVARLGAAVAAERLAPHLTAELPRGLADLAVDRHPLPLTSRGGRQPAVTFADI
jgi:hypothetical protein